MKFYRCSNCGQIIAIIKETGSPIICCGEAMQEIVPGTADASLEKHVPVYEVSNGNVTVSVGSAPHSMTEGHYIKWVFLQTKLGTQRKCLKPGMEPKACFRICPSDEIEAVYAYCNLHSLWKAASH